ncbi:MAG: hypothetical protein ACKO1Y_08080 [Actinomycetota bacterium]
MVGSSRSLRRLLAAPALAAVAVVAAASPADAHTLSGPQPSNYRTTIVGVVPDLPGVDVAIVDGGTKVELTNRTAETVVVEGYEGEPYLRVGPDGAAENLNSAATYLNRTLKGGVVPPGVDVSPDAPPDWRRISGGDTVRWHDHRAHWMGEGPPPVVAADPDARHRISTGRIPITASGERHEIVVNIDWVPGPSPGPWIALAVALGLVGLAIAAVGGARRALAGVIALLVVVDIVHAVSYARARPGSTVDAFVRILTGSFASVVVWIVAVPTVVALWRRRTAGLYGAVLVGLMVALVGGLTDADALTRSQIPTAGPALLARLEVVIALGLGFGVAIGSVVALVRGRSAGGPPTSANGRVAALVAGLDDRELRRITAGLDAEATVGALVAELAARCTPDAALLAGAVAHIEVVAADRHEPAVWTLSVRDGAVTAEAGSGPDGPGDGEVLRLCTSFPTFLRLVAGVVTLDAAIADGRAEVAGPPAIVTVLARRLPESGPSPPPPPLPPPPAPAR